MKAKEIFLVFKVVVVLGLCQSLYLCQITFSQEQYISEVSIIYTFYPLVSFDSYERTDTKKVFSFVQNGRENNFFRGFDFPKIANGKLS